VADIQTALGQHDEAHETYRRAIEMLANVTRDFPDVADYRHRWAHALNNWGLLLQKMGRLNEAETTFAEALEQYHRLPADFPNRAAARSQIAATTSNLATVFITRGDDAKARPLLERAILDQRAAVEADPRPPDYREFLATHYRNLAQVLARQGDLPKVGEAFAQAHALWKQLVVEYPSVADYHAGLAISIAGLASAAEREGHPGKAEGHYRDAVAIEERLAKAFPDFPEYQSDLARTHYHLGRFYLASKRPKEAEAALQRSLAVSQTLSGKHPKIGVYGQELARVFNELGVFYRNSGQIDLAVQNLRQAVTIREELVRDQPDHPELAVEHAGACCNLGNALNDQKQPEAARPWFDKAIEVLRRTPAKVPHHDDGRKFLRNSYFGRAGTWHAVGRLPETVADLDRAVAIDDEKLPVLRFHRALCLARLGKHVQAAEDAAAVASVETLPPGMLYDLARSYALCAAAAGGDEKQAAGYADRAVELLRRAAVQGFANVTQLKKDPDLDSIRSHAGFQALLAKVVDPAEMDRRLRHFQTTKDAAGCRALAESWEKLERTDQHSLYNAACFRAVTAAVIRATDESEGARKKAEAEAARAMAWLKQAVAAGYKDAGHVKQDKDLDALRDREDFKKLIGELDAKTKP
jgi:tetratricopeptide (TPR) repeat protein